MKKRFLWIWLVLLGVLSACSEPGDYHSWVTTNLTVVQNHYTNYITNFQKTMPSIVSTYPAANAAAVPASSNIIVNFNTDIDVTSLNDSTFRVIDASGNKVAGKITYGNKTMTFKPEPVFIPNKTYTVSISSNISSVMNYKLSADTIFSFKTAVYTVTGNWESWSWIETNTAAGCSQTKIEMDGDGNAIAIWNIGSARIYANRYVYGVGWGTAQAISPWSSFVDRPVLAMLSNGTALALWNQSDGDNNSVYYNIYRPGIGWNVAEKTLGNNLSPWGDARQIRARFYPNGNAAAIWSQNDGARWNLYISFYTLSSDSWTTPFEIDSDNNYNAPNDDYDLGIDSAGRVIVVWAQDDGSSVQRMYSRRYTTGSGWNTAEIIDSATGGSFYLPTVQCDSLGKTIVTMHNSDNTIRANILSGSSWGTLKRIDGTGGASECRFALDKNNNGLAVWHVSGHIAYCRYTNGGWTTNLRVDTNSTGCGTKIQLALLPNGSAYVVWMQQNGFSIYDTLVRRYSGSGTSWDAPQVVDTLMSGVDDPGISANSFGQAFAIWHQSDGNNESVVTRRFK